MVKNYIIVGLIAGLVVLVPACSRNGSKKDRMKQELQVGDMAPDFSLPDDTGDIRSLSEMAGKNFVLYFYPKDQTPGCTAQACSVRDNSAELENAGIQVFGVSYDSPESHRKFKEKYKLNFPLLSDSTKEVSELYGVSGWFAPSRVTFLIDKEGRILKILKNVDVKNHAQEIIAAFASV